MKRSMDLTIAEALCAGVGPSPRRIDQDLLLADALDAQCELAEAAASLLAQYAPRAALRDVAEAAARYQAARVKANAAVRAYMLAVVLG